MGQYDEHTERYGPDEPLIPCDRHPDCFACKDGLCVALSDNSFGERDCPFYKTREQNRQEMKECLCRLVMKGRYDLIRKYKETLMELGVFDADTQDVPAEADSVWEDDDEWNDDD